MATFFENQQLARRNTRVLVLLYLLAVAGVILAVDLVLAGLYYWYASIAPQLHHPGGAAYLKAVPSSVYVAGALATAAVILAVSAWHML